MLAHGFVLQYGVAASTANPFKELHMTFTRILFLALAVLLPTSWTVARAGDEAPTTEKTTTTKKTKKSKKADGTEEKTEKTDTKTEKK
jgi:hypothetical protein